MTGAIHHDPQSHMQVNRRLTVLSKRERQVAKLMLQGHSNKVMADILGINIRTVEIHRLHIMRKSGCRNIVEFVHKQLPKEPKVRGLPERTSIEPLYAPA